ncbi:hypothetical protein [Miltoncostaea oceani]|uniref:hypothetical protein n=1 Tax=Miltoncostaea oceani TaxID=2843216 RepID=UPI001C3D2314|nr:hypothetical protein [Miltoncostaea oceani]
MAGLLRSSLTLGAMLALALFAMTGVGWAAADSTPSAPEAIALDGLKSEDATTKRCRTGGFYGTSRISVKRVIGKVSCRAAGGIARAAVVYRVNSDFPDTFCHRGWCWRFGEFRGVGPGASIVTFVGRRGEMQIGATQSVS